jgi:hypothetical protein
MLDVHVKLNPVLPWQKSIHQKENSFHQQTGLNLKNKLVKCYIRSTALYGAVTWDTSESRPTAEILRELWNVALVKDREDKLENFTKN